MNVKYWLGAIALALSMLAAGPAALARPLIFTIGETDFDTSTTLATFTLNSNPTPDGINFKGTDLYFRNHPFMEPPLTVQFNAPYLVFYTKASGGGLLIGLDGNSLNSDNFVLTGPQVFTGTTSAPVFKPGTYFLQDSTGNIESDLAPFLTIAGIPEPSVWALMVIGVGLVGAALRRQQRAMSAAA